MSKRIAGIVAFGWSLTFCASSSQSPIVVAPIASGTSSVAIPEAHAAPVGVEPALARERVEAAQKVVAQNASAFAAARIGLDEVALWHENLFRAQQDVLAGQALVEAARKRVDELRKLETLSQQRAQAGIAFSTEPAKAAYYRASAEVDLARVSR